MDIFLATGNFDAILRRFVSGLDTARNLRLTARVFHTAISMPQLTGGIGYYIEDAGNMPKLSMRAAIDLVNNRGVSNYTLECGPWLISSFNDRAVTIHGETVWVTRKYGYYEQIFGENAAKLNILKAKRLDQYPYVVSYEAFYHMYANGTGDAISLSAFNEIYDIPNGIIRPYDGTCAKSCRHVVRHTHKSYTIWCCGDSDARARMVAKTVIGTYLLLRMGQN